MGLIKKTSCLFIFLMLIVSFTSCQNSKFEKEVEKEKGAVKLSREVKKGGYNLVTTKELKKWIDDGKDMIVIDTMPYEDSYQKMHVSGAKHFLFPIPEMRTWDTSKTDGKSKDDYIALLGKNKNKTIVVVYCGFVKCTRSHNGAMWAKKLGYRQTFRYPGGIFAWKGAKYKIEKGG